MQVSQFDFTLPENLIAATPLEKRDGARMLVVDEHGKLAHKQISNLTDVLRAGDVLVLNDTSVLPARIYAKRGEAKVELLLHQEVEPCVWLSFAKPGKRLRLGDAVELTGGHAIKVLEKLDDGQVKLDIGLSFPQLTEYLNIHGQVPLPPYIQKQRAAERLDKTRYQTVYSDVSKQRSVAAPTAGLHFTDDLLAACKAKGVQIAKVTLHVGAGTFLPVKAENTKDHIMHYEHWQVDEAAANIINNAKEQGGRVIAVGTTSVRTLESAAKAGRVQAGSGNTNLFITPGYEFQIVDVMLTNFHLPKSTLFMLVSAFSGLDVMQKAYSAAIKENYRFFSYGDACLLHKAA